MNAVRLRLAAGLATLITLVGATLYAASHLKSAAAPMQPPVAAIPKAGSSSHEFLAPSIVSGREKVITSTHAS